MPIIRLGRITETPVPRAAIRSAKPAPRVLRPKRRCGIAFQIIKAVTRHGTLEPARPRFPGARRPGPRRRQRAGRHALPRIRGHHLCERGAGEHRRPVRRSLGRGWQMITWPLWSHIIFALATGIACGIVAARYPEVISPLDAAILGTLVVYPVMVAMWWRLHRPGGSDR